MRVDFKQVEGGDMIIKQKKGQTLLYAIIVLIFFAMFLCFTIFDIRKLPHDYNFWLDNSAIYWILKLLCVICSIITAMADIWFFKQIFSKEPLIEICDEYFYDNSSAISLGKIAWSDMDRAYIKGGFLNIELKDSRVYFKKKNWIQMKMIKGNLKLGYGDACISSERFKKEWKTFFDEFDRRMKIEE